MRPRYVGAPHVPAADMLDCLREHEKSVLGESYFESDEDLDLESHEAANGVASAAEPPLVDATVEPIVDLISDNENKDIASDSRAQVAEAVEILEDLERLPTLQAWAAYRQLLRR